MIQKNQKNILSAWIQMLARKINTDGNILLKDRNITVMQLEVMRYIKLHPNQAQIINIANFFGVKHTSTIHVIRALEEKEYVYRESIPHNRRKKIKLTKLGEKIATQNENTVAKLEKIIFNGFSEEEKNILFQLLSRINDNLDEEFHDDPIESKKN